MESIEEHGRRWQAIFETLAEGPRRQIVGSLAELPSDRMRSLPEAANMPEYRLDPVQRRIDLVHTHLPIMERGVTS